MTGSNPVSSSSSSSSSSHDAPVVAQAAAELMDTSDTSSSSGTTSGSSAAPLPPVHHTSKTYEVRAKYGPTIHCVRLDATDTVGALKRALEDLTLVPLARQKLLGLVRGAIPLDDTRIVDLPLLHKSLSTSTNSANDEETTVVAVTLLGTPAQPPAVPPAQPERPGRTTSPVGNKVKASSSDISRKGTSFSPQRRTKAQKVAKMYLEVEKRLNQVCERTTDLAILYPPRPGARLLVLDLDYTLVDTEALLRGATTSSMRPYLSEFLARVYPYYDICVWSQTHWRWVEAKMTELHLLTDPRFKISFVLDRTSMPSVRLPGPWPPSPSVRQGMIDYAEEDKERTSTVSYLRSKMVNVLRQQVRVVLSNHPRRDLIDPDRALLTLVRPTVSNFAEVFTVWNPCKAPGPLPPLKFTWRDREQHLTSAQEYFLHLAAVIQVRLGPPGVVADHESFVLRAMQAYKPLLRKLNESEERDPATATPGSGGTPAPPPPVLPDPPVQLTSSSSSGTSITPSTSDVPMAEPSPERLVPDTPLAPNPRSPKRPRTETHILDHTIVDVPDVDPLPTATSNETTGRITTPEPTVVSSAEPATAPAPAPVREASATSPVVPTTDDATLAESAALNIQPTGQLFLMNLDQLVRLFQTAVQTGRLQLPDSQPQTESHQTETAIGPATGAPLKDTDLTHLASEFSSTDPNPTTPEVNVEVEAMHTNIACTFAEPSAAAAEVETDPDSDAMDLRPGASIADPTAPEAEADAEAMDIDSATSHDAAPPTSSPNFTETSASCPTTSALPVTATPTTERPAVAMTAESLGLTDGLPKVVLPPRRTSRSSPRPSSGNTASLRPQSGRSIVRGPGGPASTGPTSVASSSSTSATIAAATRTSSSSSKSSSSSSDSKPKKISVKPLELIWRRFGRDQYSERNTIAVDDLARNFALNPSNGILVRGYHNSPHFDTELVALERYCLQMAHESVEDMSTVDHAFWRSYRGPRAGQQ